MKRRAAVLILFLFLAGCSSQDQIRQALSLREQLTQKEGCRFEADIIADYGEQVLEFSVDSRFDQAGNYTFRVLLPESIKDISGSVRENRGFLTFDKEILEVPLLADGQLSPMSAPWVLIRTLRGGYIGAEGQEGDLTHVSLRDSYAEDALGAEVWLNAEGLPVKAEIIYKNMEILTLRIKNFSFL